MPTLLLALIAAAIYGSMAVEAFRASHNEQIQLSRGGTNAPGDVHDLMRVAYPGAFLAMLVEGHWRMPAPVAIGTGIAVFLAAKTIKWSAILTLGPRWTFRVIVVPGDTRITRGPYRIVAHPNYVGVLGELVGTALMTGAVITGPLGVAGFGALLWKRISVESRALQQLRVERPDAILRAK